jgi:hypothetical protein
MDKFDKFRQYLLHTSFEVEMYSEEQVEKIKYLNYRALWVGRQIHMIFDKPKTHHYHRLLHTAKRGRVQHNKHLYNPALKVDLFLDDVFILNENKNEHIIVLKISKLSYLTSSLVIHQKIRHVAATFFSISDFFSIRLTDNTIEEWLLKN